MEQMLREGERLDDLLVDNLRIIQDSSAFRFSIDAVLLSHFATVKPGDQVLDLGTGSGVIPLLLSTREPRLQLVGVELNPTVAERARRSVRLNNLQEKIQIITGDLRELGTLLPGYQATLVVSNPPYQPLGTGEISPRPDMAMARHEVYCQFSDVARAASRVLGGGGRFALVHRPGRLPELLTILARYHLEPKRMRLVYPRLDQAANLVLLECRKDARPGLRVLPPLVVYEGDDYSPEIMDIYGGKGDLDQ